MAKLTGDDLAAKYPDAAWRASYLELVNVVTLLRTCIIASSFRIPDRMNSAFTLSSYGARLQSDLTTKHDVPAKEARMMCLLEMAHDELIVDLGKTDIGALMDEVSILIKKGSMRYPFIYGGYLYRRAAEIFPDRRSRLNSTETMELLDGQPCGVFQVGEWVIGPLGVTRSDEIRWLPPTSRVLLQHCGNLTCHRPHGTSLSTDYDAPINQHLPKMVKVLSDDVVARGAWTDFIGLLAEESDRPYDDFDTVGVPAALGDCMTNDELETVASHLGLDVPEISDDVLRRATVLQLLWAKDDRELVRAVDFLIETGKVPMTSREIRRPPLVDLAVGSFSVRVELGAHGLRLRPDSPEVPLLRLRRLVSHLYDPGLDADRSELQWQLRTVDGGDVHDRLEEYLRTTPPNEAIERLVLARRQNVEKAMKELGIESAVSLGDVGPASDDARVVEVILWKLGFPLALAASEAAVFWERLQGARQAVRDARVSAVVDLPRLREALRELFISLEGLLGDSVEFAWWCMITDHLITPRPFIYAPSLGAPAWGELRAYAATLPEKTRLGDRDKRTLFPLGQSFAILAARLATLKGDGLVKERPFEAIPKWAVQSELKEFPLRHDSLFMDLTDGARSAIISGLETVSAELKAGNVHGIRNQVSHFQRSSLNLKEMEAAVAAAAKAVEGLEALGFIREEFRASVVERDEWTRSVVYMRSAAGAEVTLTRPSQVGAVGLPGIATPQYIVRSAVFSSRGEMLRLGVGVDSPFAKMWEGFPLPRARRPGLLDPSTDTAADVARASHGVLPGA